MGYLLKEALKALCGVNQWSYAVFWKFGCQNSKLLIWEECYHGTTMPCPSTPHSSTMGNHDGTQLGDRLHLLIDKMMMTNQVNMVGEGLVGRAAFTGNHQWIVSGNYNESAHPPEVLNEIRLQFSAGMQTIAVIPVIPHGVVQLGSSLAIMENVGFVHDVKGLILQLGCVPGVFISDSYITKNMSSMHGLPVDDVTSVTPNLHGHPMQMSSSPMFADRLNLQRDSSQTIRLANQSSNSLATQFHDNLQVSGTTFTMPILTQDSGKSLGGHCATKVNAIADFSVPPPSSLTENKVNRGVDIPSVINQPAFSDNLGSGENCPQLSSSRRSSTLLKQPIVPHPHESVSKGNHKSFQNYENCTGYRGCIAKHSPEKANANVVHEVLKGHPRLAEHMSAGNFISDDYCNASQMPSSNGHVPEDVFFQSSKGDDLYDVLGMDFKCKLLNDNGSKTNYMLDASTKEQMKVMPRSMNLQHLGSEIYSEYCEGVTESGVFSSSGCDHLLDAVISGVSSSARQISDDSMSCSSTVSKISSSTVPNIPQSHPPPSGLVNMSDQIQEQLFGLSKSMVRLGEPIGASVRSACGKNDGGNCSLVSSTYGSQISSWIEQGSSTSVSTANSKKTDEGGKTNRKRLKPGENPRPRPKDRQMIQDRVKELREIVPNGAKCSIDSLLERTIKHMLFLQSVTKHADKLKHTVESKITNREGGMLLKDNFEGGATWAFELGSQSMVCPIVVEDLNPPRQLLIEMLCEERGYFLEIADIVRGLGLTILKGVMEAQNDKIWARFAVEANRDVTRMEVFISLVHLLEQTLNGSAASANGTNDEDMMAHPVSMAAKQELLSPVVCGELSAL